MVVVWVSNEIARSVLSESMIKIEARNAEQSSRCLVVCCSKEGNLLVGGKQSKDWLE